MFYYIHVFVNHYKYMNIVHTISVVVVTLSVALRIPSTSPFRNIRSPYFHIVAFWRINNVNDQLTMSFVHECNKNNINDTKRDEFGKKLTNLLRLICLFVNVNEMAERYEDFSRKAKPYATERVNIIQKRSDIIL